MMENLDCRAVGKNQPFTLNPIDIDMDRKKYSANGLYKSEYPAAKQKSKKTVLVVDNNETELNRMLNALMHGYEVVGAANGKDALETIQNNDYDLIISEIRLPEMTGIDFLKTVKTITPQAEFIIVTAYGEVESYLEAMNLGTFEYINKPFKVPELDKVIKKAISQ